MDDTAEYVRDPVCVAYYLECAYLLYETDPVEAARKAEEWAEAGWRGLQQARADVRAAYRLGLSSEDHKAIQGCLSDNRPTLDDVEQAATAYQRVGRAEVFAYLLYRYDATGLSDTEQPLLAKHYAALIADLAKLTLAAVRSAETFAGRPSIQPKPYH